MFIDVAYVIYMWNYWQTWNSLFGSTLHHYSLSYSCKTCKGSIGSVKPLDARLHIVSGPEEKNPLDEQPCLVKGTKEHDFTWLVTSATKSITSSIIGHKSQYEQNRCLSHYLQSACKITNNPVWTLATAEAINIHLRNPHTFYASS